MRLVAAHIVALCLAAVCLTNSNAIPLPFESEAMDFPSSKPYNDPNHPAGIRYLKLSTPKRGFLEISGKDDPSEPSWTVYGNMTGANSIVVDFSPKGGPSSLNGQILEGRIEWSDGNYWGLVTEDSIDGAYNDPNHREGVRMVMFDKSGLRIQGRDDPSQAVWKVHGVEEGDLAISIDFSPKGGPANISAHFNGFQIQFADGNTWSRITATDVEGIYSDPNHPSGYRQIQLIGGGAVNVTGSDTEEGKEWTAPGHVDGISVVVDFSSKGGPANLKGTFNGFAIDWSDGNVWPKERSFE